MSNSRAASKSKGLAERMVELQQTIANIDAQPTYVPAIATKGDYTDSVPELAVLIVGNDDRVTSAFANQLRGFVEQYLEVPTVPLANLVQSENFVNYDDVREEHRISSPEFQHDMIFDQVESVWDGMKNSYPAFMRGQVRVGIEIVSGSVDLLKEVRQSATINIGETKVVDQFLSTFEP